MRAVLDDPGFEAAALTAALLTVVAVVMARGARDLRGAPAIAVLASLVGFSVEDRLDAGLAIGLAALAAGAWATHRARPFGLRNLVAVPGAVLVAASLPEPVPTWAGILVVGAIVLFGPATEVFDARAPRPAALFLLVAVIGIYLDVPETDAVRPLLAAFGVAALLAAFPRLATLPGSASAASGLLLWAAAAGGYPRPGSVVGAIGCVGVVVLAPALVAARGSRKWLVAGVLVALVLFCARVAGFEDSAWEAAALSALGFVVAGAAVYATSR